jgi:putative membrane protein
MKTLRFLFLIAIPILLLSCNRGTNPNRNYRNNEPDQDRTKTRQDKTKTNIDTINRGSMFFNLNFNDQDKDEDFVKEAISSGLMEVELGKIAGEKGTSQRVKSFGQMMVRDHSKSGEELRAIASSKNINVPSSMDDKHNRVVQDLQNKDAKDFDKAYIKEMASAHEKDIELFKKQAEDGNDPQLKTFASKNLPILLMHRDSVQNIQKDLR